MMVALKNAIVNGNKNGGALLQGKESGAARQKPVAEQADCV
jgi:hypothetical protein